MKVCRSKMISVTIRYRVDKMMRYHLTWSKFDPTSITLIEDPLTSNHLVVESFIDIYGPLLETMDGRDMASYIDFYFERSHANQLVLVFTDENARIDFREEAEMMGLIPSMKAVMEGESAQEKADRELHRKAVEKQKILKASETHAQKHRKMLMTAQTSLDLLSIKALRETDPSKKAKMEEKIRKITKMLAGKANTC